MNKEKELIDKLIDLAFAEDIGDGDHTTLSCIPATAMGKSKLLIKEAGVLAGIEVAKEIFNRFDPSMKVEVFINDGTEVKPGDVAMVVEGKVQSLLQTERLMLNVMQRPMEELKEELAAIQQQYLSLPPSDFKWQKAIIGKGDRIFLPDNQYLAWENQVDSLEQVEAAHYQQELFNTILMQPEN